MATRKNVKDEADTQELVSEVGEQTKQEVQQQKRVLESNTIVNCMSNVIGGLTFRSDFGTKGFRIEGWGKMKRIQLQDLEALYNEQPTFINQGWLYILDNDVVEYMYLTDLYEQIINPKDLERFLKLSEEEIEERLTNAPNGIKVTLAKIIKQKIEAGDKSFNIPRIRFFEEILNVKFSV